MPKNAQVASTWQPDRRITVLVNLISMAALVGLISLTIVNVWTGVLTQPSEPASNPFATFVDIFPGQPRSAVDTREFSCYGNPLTTAVDENCTMELADGVVKEIQIGILFNVIDTTTFVIRDNGLRLGDFEVFLGTPEVHRFGSMVQFLWADGSVSD